ncbi:MAG: nucleotidyltransferase domain-containing protein [Bacteroidales bacterium]
MDQAAVNTIIRFLESCLKEEGLHNASIAVFGSALNNTMGPDSDLDLIIISSDFEGKNIPARGKLTMVPELKTLRKFMIPMDVLNLTPDEYQSLVQRNMFPSKVVA